MAETAQPTKRDRQLQPCVQDLVDKTAVVTGASDGIGRAMACNLTLRGCRVIGTCSRTQSLASFNGLAGEIRAAFPSTGPTHPPPTVLGLVANILDADWAKFIADAVDKHGGYIDIFVNNAAITGAIVTGEIDCNKMREFTVGNIETPALIVDELSDEVDQLYFVSTVSPGAAYIIGPDHEWASLMYSATKAAGEAMVRTWADAFGGADPRYEFMAGTTANAISVGLTATAAVNRVPPAVLENIKKQFVGMQSVPRVASAEDVADAVGLLVGEDARWITGQVVGVNGGALKIG